MITLLQLLVYKCLYDVVDLPVFHFLSRRQQPLDRQLCLTIHLCARQKLQEHTEINTQTQRRSNMPENVQHLADPLDKGVYR